MTSRGKRAALVLGLVLAVVGCSGDDKDTGTAPGGAPTTAAVPVPSDCSAVAADPSATLPSRCLELVFTETLATQGSAALKKIAPAKLLGFGQNLCAHAATVTTGGRPVPTFAELATSSAASWGVDVAVFQEIYDAAKVLCPDALNALQAAAPNQGGIEVEYAVGGQGSTSVQFTASDGSAVQETVDPPWQTVIGLSAGTPLRLTAQGGDNMSCVISVDGTEVASAKSAGGIATCVATAAQVTAAASTR